MGRFGLKYRTFRPLVPKMIEGDHRPPQVTRFSGAYANPCEAPGYTFSDGLVADAANADDRTINPSADGTHTIGTSKHTRFRIGIAVVSALVD